MITEQRFEYILLGNGVPVHVRNYDYIGQILTCWVVTFTYIQGFWYGSLVLDRKPVSDDQQGLYKTRWLERTSNYSRRLRSCAREHD